MNYRKNEQTNDEKIYEKLGSGRLPSWVEWIFLFDDNSIYNKMKQEHDNLELNAELIKCFAEKDEKEKALMIALIEQIYEYMVWEQTEDAKAYAAKVQENNNMAEDYRRDEDRLMKDSSTEKGWLENLIKDLLPTEEQHYYHSVHSILESKIQEASEADKVTINNVLKLAARNEKIREFIFQKPETDDKVEHCQLMLERILFVGNALKNEIPSNKVLQAHIHAHLKTADNRQQTESEVPRTKIGPR